MEVPIESISIPQPNLLINNMTIAVHAMTFGKDATFFIQLFPEGIEYLDKPIIKYIKVEGQEYLNWKDDDNYIINLICQKLGIRLKI
jgi:hypothetical protein